MGAIQWYVYRNLNDASDVIVASSEVMVAGIYELVAGPFDTEKAARKEAAKLTD